MPSGTGQRTTPINTELKGAFLEHQVRTSEPVVALVDAELLPLFDQVDTTGAGIAHTVVIGDLPATMPAALASTSVQSWAALTEAATEPRTPTDPLPSDVCTIMYTSGTTGPSKGVLLPQAHCFLFAKGASDAIALVESDHYFVGIGDEWGQDFEERFGVRLFQGFGMTEVNMVSYIDPADPVQAGCAGRVLTEHFDVIIADPRPTSRSPPVRSGRSWCGPATRSASTSATSRWRTRRWRRGGTCWFHTGDAGRFDAEGRLFHVDRLRDRIRRRGENISSYEVEQVVNSHPAVAESAAVGCGSRAPAARRRSRSAWRCTPAPKLDPVALLDFCRDRMPRYAVPRYVEVHDELDKTPSGKIRKQAMRDAAISAATWDRESVGYQLRR